MRITNTRVNEYVSAADAIIKGIGSENGLYIFDELPQIDYREYINLDYSSLCIEILVKLFPEFSREEISEVVKDAYNDEFDEGIVNMHYAMDAYFLELFHGPTLAFKDMALRIMPRLLALAKKHKNIKANTIILTATSGDTGGASLSGASEVEGLKLIVFYPNQGVSKFQEAQMLFRYQFQLRQTDPVLRSFYYSTV